MHYLEQREERGLSVGIRIVTFVFRIALAIIIPIVAFVVLYAGFVFLRAGDAPKWLPSCGALAEWLRYTGYSTGSSKCSRSNGRGGSSHSSSSVRP